MFRCTRRLIFNYCQRKTDNYRVVDDVDSKVLLCCCLYLLSVNYWAIAELINHEQPPGPQQFNLK